MKFVLAVEIMCACLVAAPIGYGLYRVYEINHPKICLGGVLIPKPKPHTVVNLDGKRSACDEGE